MKRLPFLPMILACLPTLVAADTIGSHGSQQQSHATTVSSHAQAAPRKVVPSPAPQPGVMPIVVVPVQGANTHGPRPHAGAHRP